MPRLTQKDLTDRFAALRAVLAAFPVEDDDPASRNLRRHLEGAAAAIEQLVQASESGRVR